MMLFYCGTIGENDIEDGEEIEIIEIFVSLIHSEFHYDIEP